MKQGKKHEPNIDTYAIGSADSIKVDYVGGTDTVHFDLKQIKENDFVRYFIEGFGHGVYYDTPKIPDDMSVAQCWIDDIDERTGYNIRAVIVPEYLSNSFEDLTDYKVRYIPR
jgi:hypothetical protein